MTVMARDFIRRFSHFKRQVEAGKQLNITDRQGRTFVFTAKKPDKLLGGGRRFYKGIPVSPEPVPEREWKGLR